MIAPGRRAPLVIACLALVSLALIAPAILEGRVLSAQDIVLTRDIAAAGAHPDLRLSQPENPLLFDAAYVFHPDLREIREQLASGSFPTWTDGIGAGRPLWASLQHGASFPLTWIAFVLPFERSLALILALKAFLAALGTFLFARALGRSNLGSAVPAVAFSLSPYFVAWLQHPHTSAYALLPWCLLAARAAVARPDPLRVAAVALAGALTLLAGHPASSAIVLITALAYAAFELARARPLRRSARAAAGLAAGALLGLGVAAIALLPFYEAVRLTENYERGAGGAPREILASLLAAEWWGRPEWGFDEGPPNFAERTLFLGTLPLLLAAAGLVLRRSRAQLFLLGLFGAALLVSLHVPYLADAIEDVPLAGSINVKRFVVVAIFAAAMLAGYGLDAMRQRRPTASWRTYAIAAAVALAPLLIVVIDRGFGGFSGSLVAQALLIDTPETADAARAAAGLRWLLLCGWLVAGLRLVRRAPRAWAGGAVALTCLELLVPAAGYHTFMDESAALPAASPAIVALQQTPDAQRSLGWGLVGPNTALDHDLRDPRAHDHPPVRRYAALWQRLAGGSVTRTEITHASPQKEKLLALFAVRRILHDPNEVVAEGLRRISDPRYPLWLSDNRAAFPRAWVAYGSRSSSSLGQSLDRIAAADTPTLREQPVVEGAGDVAALRASAPARVVKDEAHEVVVRASAADAAHLVLADTFDPGWKAWVDGEPAPILAANGAFRAVRLPAGLHTVSFRYEPRSLSAGAAISGAATLLLLLLAGLGARRLPRPSLAALGDLDGRSLYLAPWTAARRARARFALASGRMAHRATRRGLREAPAPPEPDPRVAGPGRRLDLRALVLVLVLTMAGASIGAAADPLPRKRFRAEAVIAVQGESANPPGPRQEESIRAALDTPEVLRAARTAAGLDWPLDEVRRSLDVNGSGPTGLVRVSALAESQPAADRLADTASAEAVAVLRRRAQLNLTQGGTTSAFDFETSLSAWDQPSPRFTIAPNEVRRVRGEASSGDHFLRVSCRGPASGCGPSAALSRTFDEGVAYTAQAFVRAETPVRVRLVLGGDPRDVVVGTSTRARRSWRPLTVTWTPRRPFTAADVGIQLMQRGGGDFDVDNVVVRDPRDVPLDPELEQQVRAEASRIRVQRAAREDRYAVLTPATPLDQVRGSTVGSGLYGGLLGFLAAVGGLGAAALAGKRKPQGEDQPDP